MPKLNIEVDNYSLAPVYARQIWVGSAFAFIAPTPGEDNLQTGLNNFYGLGATPPRRTLALLPDGLVFPGFKVQPAARPLKLAPVLLPDKEIYRAGEDNVRILIVAPGWLFETSGAKTARLVVENNGATYRAQSVALSEGGLTLVELGKLPEGGYRVYWDGDEAADFAGDKAECRFSSVEYVLSPLQATLMAHELNEKRLVCRLKVERFNEPLNEPVQIELWSGNRRLGQERVKPATPGIFNTEFKLKASATERLELRVSYLDQLATAVIPGSRKAERDETLLSGLGNRMQVSLMPREGSRAVRGLYLNEDNMVTNTPVSLTDPAPGNRKAILRWQLAAQAARLLVLDMHGGVIENRDLGEVSAGQEIEVDVPAPGGFVALGAWLGEKAWEGWSVLLAPSKATLKIEAPTTARPGKEIELKLTTDSLASVYLLVRDSRLAGAGPQERLAASLKRGLEGVNQWATLGYVILSLDRHADWPPDTNFYRYSRTYGGGPLPPPAAPMMMPMPASAPMNRPMMQTRSTGALFRAASASSERLAEYTLSSMDIGAEIAVTRSALFLKKGGVGLEGLEDEAAPTDPRRDFADVAFCGVVQTDKLGQATLTLKLPDTITSYSIEAFSLSADGAEWAETRESLEVSQPLWAEFSLPAFVYPGDSSPSTLELGCKGGQFHLRLLCDGTPVKYTLSGAKQLAPDTFEGHRAKLMFEAKPGLWRAELEDLKTQERDATERTVSAIGHFKGLARRFQLAIAGETISRSKLGALQIRLLPSLDKPFNVLCDATTNYSHKCCEQTAAKLIAAVAALIAGGEQVKLRDAILAGVAREKLMYLPGRGFTMYPPKESGGDTSPNDYWGKLAAEHLWSISLVGQPLLTPSAGNTAFDPEISRALQDAMAMGEDAAKAYKLELVPTQIESGRDAYRAIATNAPSHSNALAYARRTLQAYADNGGNGAQGAVLAREEQAYCAAALLAGGDQSNMALAIGAANRLASSLDGDGRLYSTVDSVALISLMTALRAAGIGTGGQSDSRVRLDSREMALNEAIEIAAAGQSEEISVLSGAALVELTSEISEDWNAFRAELPVGVQLVRPGKLNLRPLRVGDTLELVVKIEQYEPGLLVHVCLPPALSRIEGGGEVKKFSVDFAGRNEVRIPLRATGATLPVGEHWAILVRNMFKEEQAGNPGVQLIKVAAD